MRILVSAANGKTGRHVIDQLLKRHDNVTIRAFARAPVSRVDPRLEMVLGDMDDPAARARAAEGVDAVIHYGPPVDPRETAIGTGMIDAAVAAGVHQFTYVSVIHPQIEDLPNHTAKLAVEGYLINSGIEWAVIRPQHLMQNVNVLQVIEDGVLAMPYAPELVLGHVDLGDVAEAAIKVTCESGYTYAAFDADGGENLCALEICTIIEELSGRKIAYKQLSADDQIAIRMAGKPITNYTIEGYHRVCSYYSRRGMHANPHVLRWLLGRAPATWAPLSTQ
ncbi:MAG: NAD(P)H-binding protein [Novosphingobium sp.]